MHRFLITSSDLLDKVIALYPLAQSWNEMASDLWLGRVLILPRCQQQQAVRVGLSTAQPAAVRAQCCVYSCRLFVLSMPFVLSHPPKSDNRIIFQSFNPRKKKAFFFFFKHQRMSGGR